jgi:nicotinic acid mononucleotide adenylyltransferase
MIYKHIIKIVLVTGGFDPIHSGHPNDKGYKIIADNIYNILTTNFNGQI